MVYENDTSRVFSPVKLGEIISVRNFTPSRQVNPWAESDAKFSELLSLDASGSLLRRDKPKGSMYPYSIYLGPKVPK